VDPIGPILPIGSRIPEVTRTPALRRIGPDQRNRQHGDAERGRERSQNAADGSPGKQAARPPARRSEDRQDRPGPHIDISA
jgi:hypothetical protein